MSENNSVRNGILGFCSKHKVMTVIIVLIVFGAIGSIISSIRSSIRKSELDKRDYELVIDALEDSYACNATSSGKCVQRIISGTVKKYPDIEIMLEGYHECSLNGVNFECDYEMDLSDYYETENLSQESLPNEIEKIVTVSVRVDNSSSDVVSKKVTIKYNLSESDKTIIANRQQEWVAKKNRETEEKEADETKDPEVAQQEGESAASQEQASSPAPVQATSGTGYQAIYDEYAARLRNECPVLSISECADIELEGVEKMADYMWSAKGIDGQYGTYEEWSGKLWDVYMESAR